MLVDSKAGALAFIITEIIWVVFNCEGSSVFEVVLPVAALRSAFVRASFKPFSWLSASPLLQPMRLLSFSQQKRSKWLRDSSHEPTLTAYSQFTANYLDSCTQARRTEKPKTKHQLSILSNLST